jgi:hypothetical protein
MKERKMRFGISLLSCAALLALGAARADAASCSAFVVSKFFPKPEGSPRDSTKIPASCKGNVTKSTDLQVKGTGGRMSVTQVRTNFEGKMLNNLDDPAWLPAKLDELIKAKTQVVLIVRPGMAKNAPLGVTTLYLPAGPDDLAEIKRLEDLAEDVE